MTEHDDVGGVAVAEPKEKKERNPGQWCVARETPEGNWSLETEDGGITAAGRKDAMRKVDDKSTGDGRLWAFRATEFKPMSRQVVDVVAREVWS